MSWVAAAALLIAAGCGDSQIEARDPAGRYSFLLIGPAEARPDRDRVLWEIRQPALNVVAQRVPGLNERGERRTAREVARAITERYALGEVRGSMRSEPCQVGGVSAFCLRGWIAGQSDPSRELTREGVLVPIDDAYVLLEAIGSREDVARQVGLIRDTLRIEDRS